jgi:hypothetical protein
MLYLATRLPNRHHMAIQRRLRAHPIREQEGLIQDLLDRPE